MYDMKVAYTRCGTTDKLRKPLYVKLKIQSKEQGPDFGLQEVRSTIEAIVRGLFGDVGVGKMAFSILHLYKSSVDETFQLFIIETSPEAWESIQAALCVSAGVVNPHRGKLHIYMVSSSYDLCAV